MSNWLLHNKYRKIQIGKKGFVVRKYQLGGEDEFLPIYDRNHGTIINSFNNEFIKSEGFKSGEIPTRYNLDDLAFKKRKILDFSKTGLPKDWRERMNLFEQSREKAYLSGDIPKIADNLLNKKKLGQDEMGEALYKDIRLNPESRMFPLKHFSPLFGTNEFGDYVLNIGPGQLWEDISYSNKNYRLEDLSPVVQEQFKEKTITNPSKNWRGQMLGGFNEVFLPLYYGYKVHPNNKNYNWYTDIELTDAPSKYVYAKRVTDPAHWRDKYSEYYLRGVLGKDRSWYEVSDEALENFRKVLDKWMDEGATSLIDDRPIKIKPSFYDYQDQKTDVNYKRFPVQEELPGYVRSIVNKMQGVPSLFKHDITPIDELMKNAPSLYSGAYGEDKDLPFSQKGKTLKDLAEKDKLTEEDIEYINSEMLKAQTLNEQFKVKNIFNNYINGPRFLETIVNRNFPEGSSEMEEFRKQTKFPNNSNTYLSALGKAYKPLVDDIKNALINTGHHVQEDYRGPYGNMLVGIPYQSRESGVDLKPENLVPRPGSTIMASGFTPEMTSAHEYGHYFPRFIFNPMEERYKNIPYRYTNSSVVYPEYDKFLSTYKEGQIDPYWKNREEFESDLYQLLYNLSEDPILDNTSYSTGFKRPMTAKRDIRQIEDYISAISKQINLNQGITQDPVMARIGLMWTNSTPEQKKQFVDLFNKYFAKGGKLPKYQKGNKVVDPPANTNINKKRKILIFGETGKNFQPGQGKKMIQVEYFKQGENLNKTSDRQYRRSENYKKYDQLKTNANLRQWGIDYYNDPSVLRKLYNNITFPEVLSFDEEMTKNVASDIQNNLRTVKENLSSSLPSWNGGSALYKPSKHEIYYDKSLSREEKKDLFPHEALGHASGAFPMNLKRIESILEGNLADPNDTPSHIQNDFKYFSSPKEIYAAIKRAQYKIINEKGYKFDHTFNDEDVKQYLDRQDMFDDYFRTIKEDKRNQVVKDLLNQVVQNNQPPIPGNDYKFKGSKVTEIPIAQEGLKIPKTEEEAKKMIEGKSMLEKLRLFNTFYQYLPDNLKELAREWGYKIASMSESPGRTEEHINRANTYYPLRPYTGSASQDRDLLKLALQGDESGFIKIPNSLRDSLRIPLSDKELEKKSRNYPAYWLDASFYNAPEQSINYNDSIPYEAVKGSLIGLISRNRKVKNLKPLDYDYLNFKADSILSSPERVIYSSNPRRQEKEGHVFPPYKIYDNISAYSGMFYRDKNKGLRYTINDIWDFDKDYVTNWGDHNSFVSPEEVEAEAEAMNNISKVKPYLMMDNPVSGAPKLNDPKYKVKYPGEMYQKKMQEGGQIKNPKTGEEVPLQGEQPESVFKKTKNNWLNKAYWTWENKKPQLLKDAEILDPIAPMLQYLSSNADSEVGLALVSPAKVLNNVGRNIVSKIPTSTLERIRNSKIINTLWPESKVLGSSPGISSKINDVIKSRIVKEKFKAKEEGINFVRDWVSDPEVQKVIAQDPHGYMFSINNLNRGYLTKPELVAGNWGQSYGDGFYRINRNLAPKDIKTTTIHEATHNLTGNHSTKRMYDIVKNAFGGEDAIEALKNANINNPKGLKQIKYLTNPTEVYARMMEIRNAFGLKPGEVVGNSIGKEAFVKGVTGNLPIEKSFFRLGALTTNSTDGGWIRFLLNSLPGTVPAGIIGGSMYMNNKAKNKE